MGKLIIGYPRKPARKKTTQEIAQENQTKEKAAALMGSPVAVAYRASLKENAEDNALRNAQTSAEWRAEQAKKKRMAAGYLASKK